MNLKYIWFTKHNISTYSNDDFQNLQLLFKDYLQQRSLDFLQIGHPEPLLSACDECGPDGVLEHLVDAIVGEDGGLVIVEAEFSGHVTRLVRHHEIRLPGGPDERAAVPEVAQVRLVPVHVPVIGCIISPEMKPKNHPLAHLRSFLHPTNSTGVLGQNLLISGYHISRQFLSDTGLLTLKHSRTTSDLP